MPKIIYQCDKCHKPFDSIEKAVKCEKSHPEILKITYEYEEGSRFPDGVSVSFDNFSVIYYKKEIK